MAADAEREGKRRVTRERKRGGERKEGEGGGRIKRRWKGEIIGGARNVKGWRKGRRGGGRERDERDCYFKFKNSMDHL